MKTQFIGHEQEYIILKLAKPKTETELRNGKEIS